MWQNSIRKHGMTRRQLLCWTLSSAAVTLMAACSIEQQEEQTTMPRNRQPRQTELPATEGRLQARPAQVPPQATAAGSTGLQPIGIDRQQDALLYVPSDYTRDRPAPLVLMLHGAGGNAEGGIAPFQALADETGTLLLAPSSRGRTWDVILGGYGPDINLIDQLLTHTFERYAVDSDRIAVEGFSDGASYALSLGITNGDLFTHVIAFSPGFMAPAAQEGAPRIYISHGIHDQVLPIDRCSRRIVPQLERAGYDVRYHEFDGPHTVPGEIAREGLDWFLA